MTKPGRRGSEKAAIVSLLLVLPFLQSALAHGPRIEVSKLWVVTTEEGKFLEMSLDPPEEGAEQFALIAVSTPFGPAELEQRTVDSYQPVERIPAVHGAELSAETPFRVRLATPLAVNGLLPVTLLFNGGVLLREEIMTEPTTSSSVGPWARGAAIAGLLAIMLIAGAWRVRRGKGRRLNVFH
ncbi:MAG: hypothetical protein WD314_06320 [Trueperaceae bacterium]